uniref:Fungal lipase-like domain-containing protein n=1 Tax=Leersia perrieri TaxID=77586 RepID=A0A0D9WZR5_9ORYZ
MHVRRGKEEHRRCVAACHVKGVYVIESDIHKRRVYSRDALAPSWWNTFGFRPLDVIKDDKLIFGIIYEYEAAAGLVHHPSAPHYVVAFRGTMLRHRKAMTEDLRHDIKVMVNTLPESTRFNISREMVEKLLHGVTNNANVASCNVWLAGHSLGASHALDVGRFMMTEKGFNLPTFLFNPPQVSLAPVIDLLRPIEAVKEGIYTASYFLKARLGEGLQKPHKDNMIELFKKLAPWTPELFVHEKDPICQGYIYYFEQSQNVQERFHGVARSAKTLSYRDMLCAAFGKEKERPHLLPSARLWKNSAMVDVDEDAEDQHKCKPLRYLQRLKKQAVKAHSLKQWWKPDSELSLNSTLYNYPSP